MNRVLLYSNRKIDTIAWDATNGKEEKAFLALFNYLDKEWRMFENGDDKPVLYEAAKGGNGLAAKEILEELQGEEYLRWEMVYVTELV
ncbi:hypothetical protein CL614_00155 [archaeon]|nr:hypothetical protein [archaeon]|tara:strand:- start:340 stop:603 length:264 start_codon:yes stop_codon:yes gene_type:complete